MSRLTYFTYEAYLTDAPMVLRGLDISALGGAPVIRTVSAPQEPRVVVLERAEQ